ncbi:hypothetical protein RBB80_10930 [Tunturiibacter gelidiferens]
MERGIACIDKDATKVDEFSLDGEDRLKDLGGGIVEDFVLKLVDAVVEVVDRGEVEIDNGVEDEGDEFSGLLVVSVPPGMGWYQGMRVPCFGLRLARDRFPQSIVLRLASMI